MTGNRLTASASGLFLHALHNWLQPGSAPAEWRNSRSRVPFAQVVDGFARAADTRLDVGLRFAEHIKPGAFGALGYAAMTCRTLGDVLPLIPRYGKLVFDFGQPIELIQQQADDVTLLWAPEQVAPDLPWSTDHPGFRAVTDSIIGGWYRFGCWITQQCKPPSRVTLRATAPANPQPWHDFFGIPVEFAAPCNSLSFPRSYLELPLAQADSVLHQTLQQQAEALLQDLNKPDLARQVQHALLHCLPLGEATLAEVARQLATTERTLQRRLAEQMLGFQTLLSQTRYQLARQHLANPALSVLDIALLLGYAEQSAFSKAFRLWSGLSPAQYRHSLAATPTHLA
ncbi:AraC family transcriptional regulator [Leeia aquatica]|uniref:AraC family transcriptional regulator n=1 Tax=Leeia aquatica TaxID=2725557 RepID=A0A847SD40_9NEIS|nr:AraC family transcriptional regulator [Leeia aquatica]NLR75376.1 AraC family transcriptional regulator [Leeia aquatica]